MFEGATSMSVCNKDYIARSWKDNSAFPYSSWEQTSICCSPGKWSSVVGITRVEECENNCPASPAGKYSSVAGITRVEDCENDCPAGKYSSVPGITRVGDCEDCPAGGWCPPGTSSGLETERCPAGKFSSLKGLSRLEDCEGVDCPVGSKVMTRPGLASLEECEPESAVSGADHHEADTVVVALLLSLVAVRAGWGQCYLSVV